MQGVQGPHAIARYHTNCILCEKPIGRRRGERLRFPCRRCRSEFSPIDELMLVEIEGKAPCVLCGDEVRTGERWTGARNGRDHWVCAIVKVRSGLLSPDD